MCAIRYVRTQLAREGIDNLKLLFNTECELLRHYRIGEASCAGAICEPRLRLAKGSVTKAVERVTKEIKKMAKPVTGDMIQRQAGTGDYRNGGSEHGTCQSRRVLLPCRRMTVAWSELGLRASAARLAAALFTSGLTTVIPTCSTVSS